MDLRCLNCGNIFDGAVSFDELGWHSSCPNCKGSFDVDLKNDYVVDLWRYDFSPRSSIDDLPEHHEFIKQFTFNKTKTIKECEKLNRELETYEGNTYELFGADGRLISRGVFAADSLHDDVWG